MLPKLVSMRSGYLLIENDPALPGVIQVRGVEEKPAVLQDRLTYIARFADLDAALMHFHSGLARRLIDVDKRLYRVSKGQAEAIAEAIELPHRCIFLTPQLAGSRGFLEAVERLHRAHRRRSLLFDWVGMIALLALLTITLVGL